MRDHNPLSRCNAEAKVRRDAQIVADRARGLQWATISARYGLSERQCREIWKTYRATKREIFDERPEDAIIDVVASIDAVIEDLALVAESAKHDAVRLGAVKARLAAIRQRAEVLCAVGVLPEPAHFAALVEYDRVIETIMGVFRENGVEDHVYAALATALRGCGAPEPVANGQGRSFGS